MHFYGTQTQSSECVKVERQPLPKVQGGVPSILADADGGDRRCLAPLWPFPILFFFLTYLLWFVILKAFFCSRSPCSKKRHWSSCWYSGMLTSCLAWLWGSTWSHQKGASPSRVGSRGRQRGVSANWTHIFLSITMTQTHTRTHRHTHTHCHFDYVLQFLIRRILFLFSFKSRSLY